MKEVRLYYRLILSGILFISGIQAQKVIFRAETSLWNSRITGESNWIKGFPDVSSNENYFYPHKQLDTISWESKTYFKFSPKEKNGKITLAADGLSPYAKIYVNEHFIGCIGSSMHVKRFSVGEFLIPNHTNEIRISFPSPLLEAKKEYQNDLLNYPSDNEEGKRKLSQFLRIPPVCFGWDIAEKRLPSRIGNGIWLEENPPIQIEEMYFTTESIKNDTTHLRVSLNLSSETKVGRTKILLQISHRHKEILEIPLTAAFLNGRLDTVFSVKIPHPKLWWPNGVFQQHHEQEPNFYYGSLKVFNEAGEKIAERQQKFGVRTIELIQSKDSFGDSFYFSVNGIKLFAKGANYVPDFSDKNYIRWTSLINEISVANFNMLRVWGGGTYLNEKQMSDCDEKGILVWQDFPFSGTMYPSDSLFLARLNEEVTAQIKEKRYHPSLALWCGNNEIDVAWKNWGWQQTYDLHGKDSIQLAHGYNSIFRKLLPEIIHLHDGKTPYLHTSPLSNWGKESDFRSGDNHYWGVWHGEYPISTYTKFIPRFMSEFGIPSLPSQALINHHFNLHSFSATDSSLIQRMRSYKGIRLLEKYISDEFGTPKNLQSFIWLSQLLQANALQQAIQAHRRAKPFCMGSLFWQLNDAWPGITWSMIDYEGRNKIAMASVKKSFEPLLLTATLQRKVIQLHAVSDFITDTVVKIRLRLYTETGNCILDSILTKIIPHESSLVIFEKTIDNSKMEAPVACLISTGNGAADNNRVIFFPSNKEISKKQPDIQTRYKNGEMEIQSQLLEKDLLVINTNSGEIIHRIEVLVPNETYRLKIKQKQFKECRVLSWKELIAEK